MKSGKLAHPLAFLVLAAAALPASAQSGGDCMVTNFDRAKNAFTIASPSPNAVNQQCFIHVVPKGEAGAAAPGTPGSQLVEGNYVISLSGGGGGGGGGGSSGDGAPGAPAPQSQTTQHLAPGTYRVTIGAGGMGGMGCTAEMGGQHGWDGNPTSLSNAHTNQHIAGFPRAEYWVATAPGIASASVGSTAPVRERTSAAAGSGIRQPVRSAAPGDVMAADFGNGGRGGRGGQVCAHGVPGEPGFISIRPAP
jgi:hypothetical protein